MARTPGLDQHETQIESAVIDLPDHSSPTSATTSPRPTSRSMPVTTSTSSSVPGRGKATERPWTVNTGSKRTIRRPPERVHLRYRSALLRGAEHHQPRCVPRLASERVPKSITEDIEATTVEKTEPWRNRWPMVRSILNWASRNIRPQLAWSDPAPMPRKLRPASARIACLKSRVVCTIKAKRRSGGRGGTSPGYPCSGRNRAVDVEFLAPRIPRLV